MMRAVMPPPAKPDIGEAEIDEMDDVVRAAKRRWPWRDIGDLRHDALWGLYLAWDTFDPAPTGDPPRSPDWDIYRRAHLWWAMRNGMRTEIARRQRFDHESMDAPDYRDIAAAVTVEDEVLAKLDAARLAAALRDALPAVCDAVLRRGSDAEIGRRYGIPETPGRRGNARVAALRQRWLTAYLVAESTGAPMRHPRPQALLRPEALDYARAQFA